MLGDIKMALDKIKELVEDIVGKLKDDPALLKNFKAEPIKTLEKLLNIDLPDDQIEAVVKGVKAKLDIDDFKDNLGDVSDKLKGLGNLFKK